MQVAGRKQAEEPHLGHGDCKDRAALQQVLRAQGPGSQHILSGARRKARAGGRNFLLMKYKINIPRLYKGAHKTVILKITIMASVRRDWQRNNGYLVRAGYPLFLPPRKAIDLFTAFRYNCLKSILVAVLMFNQFLGGIKQ